MESESVPSSFVDPEWLPSLLQDCSVEGSSFVAGGGQILKQLTRSVMWNLSFKLGYDSLLVPGQACRILEHFFSTQLRNYNLNDAEEVQAFLESFRPRIFSLITCSIQLTVKMNTSLKCLSTTSVSIVLASCGINHTAQEIVDTEKEIFSAIGFRIPLFTSVEMGEMLIAEVTKNVDIIEATALIVYIAEYYRNSIEEEVRWVANFKYGVNNSEARICSLHLAAGAAAAAMFLLGQKSNPTSRLGKMIRVPSSYVGCVRNAILEKIMRKFQQGG